MQALSLDQPADSQKTGPKLLARSYWPEDTGPKIRRQRLNQRQNAFIQDYDPPRHAKIYIFFDM
jgi:hypothetical protein